MKKEKAYLEINDEKIPFHLILSPRLKGIKIVIDLKGIRVYYGPMEEWDSIRSLLQKKSKWVFKNYMKLKTISENSNKNNGVGIEWILYKGMEYRIELLQCENEETSVKMKENKFFISINKDKFKDNMQEQVKIAVKDYLKAEGIRLIAEKLEVYSKIIGVKYNNFRIKEQKTRWGSCSSKGNLNFNWKLIMAPQWVLDYVVIHELCHLIHMNHSKEFWNTVAKYCNNYKGAMSWLHENSIKMRFS